MCKSDERRFFGYIRYHCGAVCHAAANNATPRSPLCRFRSNCDPKGDAKRIANVLPIIDCPFRSIMRNRKHAYGARNALDGWVRMGSDGWVRNGMVAYSGRSCRLQTHKRTSGCRMAAIFQICGHVTAHESTSHVCPDADQQTRAPLILMNDVASMFECVSDERESIRWTALMNNRFQ